VPGSHAARIATGLAIVIAMARLPNVLVAVGAAILGWTVAPLVGADAWRPIGALAGVAAVDVGLALGSRRVRARLGWLPARSRLAALWEQEADLRAHLKDARKAGGLDRIYPLLLRSDVGSQGWDGHMEPIERHHRRVLQVPLGQDHGLRRVSAVLKVSDPSVISHRSRITMVFLLIIIGPLLGLGLAIAGLNLAGDHLRQHPCPSLFNRRHRDRLPHGGRLTNSLISWH
jgi:hypothetical protein